MPSDRHPTTRRGFIAAAGFGGVSLYALWAGYGAAPSPFALFEQAAGPATGGHDAHGGAGGEINLDEFRRLTAEFIERHSTPDGSVRPRAGRGEAQAQPGAAHANAANALAGIESGHGSSHAIGDMGPAAAAPAHMGHADTAGAQSGDTPVDIYLLAERWYYEPANLRLEPGVPYRFRMMATDVSHGASIQFGIGSRMIRLRPGRMTELQVQFTQRGSFLVYCTVYCGDGHDVMQGRIDVV